MVKELQSSHLVLGELGAESTENGVITHRYDIELSADGGFTVNGEDMSVFLGR